MVRHIGTKDFGADNLLNDERFKRMYEDPRFERAPAKIRKVEIDSRFNSAHPSFARLGLMNVDSGVVPGCTPRAPCQVVDTGGVPSCLN